MSELTTHVLDLTSGRPAAGVAVRVYLRAPWADPKLLGEMATNADGRALVLEGEAFAAGTYRLAFEIGAHFARSGAAVTDPPFLDVVVIDFAVADASRRHHVPLLVSPYGYSTYRGS